MKDIPSVWRYRRLRAIAARYSGLTCRMMKLVNGLRCFNGCGWIARYGFVAQLPVPDSRLKAKLSYCGNQSFHDKCRG